MRLRNYEYGSITTYDDPCDSYSKMSGPFVDRVKQNDPRQFGEPISFRLCPVCVIYTCPECLVFPKMSCGREDRPRLT